LAVRDSQESLTGAELKIVQRTLLDANLLLGSGILLIPNRDQPQCGASCYPSAAAARSNIDDCSIDLLVS
jgi:hypothetical protein